MQRIKGEQGHALYIVLVVSFLLFMVLAHTLFYYLNQVNIVQMKEENLRAQILLQSGLVLWAERVDQQFVDQIQKSLEDGVVHIERLSETTEEIWHLRVSVRPNSNKDTRYRANFKIDKKSKQIIEWTDKISDDINE